jgi:cytochrome c
MRRLFIAFALTIAAFVASPFVATAQMDDSHTAMSMVDKAIAFYDANGREKALAAFSDKTNHDFVSGEFYVIAADAEKGLFLAHPINPGLVNNPKIWDLQDVNKAYIVRDMVAAGKATPDGGWTEYVWTHPETKKLTPKKTYVKAHDGLLFMVGYYVK